MDINRQQQKDFKTTSNFNMLNLKSDALAFQCKCNSLQNDKFD